MGTEDGYRGRVTQAAEHWVSHAVRRDDRPVQSIGDNLDALPSYTARIAIGFTS